MTEPEVGRTYLYRKFGGAIFHVEVLEVRGAFALCHWDVYNIDGGYSYEKIGWKPVWRILTKGED